MAAPHSKPLALVSEETPESERKRLSAWADVLSLPPDPDLAPPVASHPDMICVAFRGKIFFSRRYAEAFPALIREIKARSGFEAVLSDAPRSGKYPFDVGANVLFWERRDGEPLLVGRLDAVFPEILSFAEDEGIRRINVRQGYAACSCLALPGALLTADDGIIKALAPFSDSAFWVPNEGILLPGYDEGFLGGTSGVLDSNGEKRVFFFGDPSSMEYAETLSRLLDRYEAEPVLLSEDPLTDRGGIRFLEPQINH